MIPFVTVGGKANNSLNSLRVMSLIMEEWLDENLSDICTENVANSLEA